MSERSTDPPESQSRASATEPSATKPSKTRRFIAGAVCPRCSLMDKIVVDTQTNARHCVSCGFTEERPATPPDNAVPDLQTRVNRPAARRVETPAEAVRLVDPGDADSADR